MKQHNKNDFRKNKNVLLSTMENNTLTDFFEFINKECLFYTIEIKEDVTVHTKWENLQPDDYTISGSTQNKIILRLHKTKQKVQPYFLDCFQHVANQTHWKGFCMGLCIKYEIQEHQMDKDEFDAIFSFSNNQQLHVYHINTKVFLILQDFFSGLM